MSHSSHLRRRNPPAADRYREIEVMIISAPKTSKTSSTWPRWGHTRWSTWNETTTWPRPRRRQPNVERSCQSQVPRRFAWKWRHGSSECRHIRARPRERSRWGVVGCFFVMCWKVGTHLSRWIIRSSAWRCRFGGLRVGPMGCWTCGSRLPVGSWTSRSLCRSLWRRRRWCKVCFRYCESTGAESVGCS